MAKLTTYEQYLLDRALLRRRGNPEGAKPYKDLGLEVRNSLTIRITPTQRKYLNEIAKRSKLSISDTLSLLISYYRLHSN